MSMNLVTLLYLIASVCFIQALKGLSHPTSSRRGNLFGMVGMAIAVLTTVGLVFKLGAQLAEGGNAAAGIGYILVGLLIGGSAGSIMAKRVEMTKMPELVAFMHSMIGLAAVFIAIAAVVEPQSLGIVQHLGDTIPTGNRLELFLGAAIGAITFSGSVIAFGKLSGKYKFRLFQGAPVQFAGQHLLNLVLGLATLGLGLVFMFTGNLAAFALMLALAFVLGVLIIIPIGGADMPVVISLYNAFTGLAVSFEGYVLGNEALIIAGMMVGAAGILLTRLMAKAMNRPISGVLFSHFGGGGQGAAEISGSQKPIEAADVAAMMAFAERVVIVPGYGMAVAQAQHKIWELAQRLIERGVKVKFAIHPVAGRMPGHMNVLLAEAGVPYDLIADMDDINPEFATTDVSLVIGANDVVNPVAKTDPSSPIYGMPILDVVNSRNTIVIKRGKGTGFAGIENALFYADNTRMLYGDGAEAASALVSELKALDGGH